MLTGCNASDPRHQPRWPPPFEEFEVRKRTTSH